MVIYISITIILIFLSKRHNNVQCDGKNSLICYLFFSLLIFQFLMVIILLLDFINLIRLQSPVKSLKTVSTIIQKPINVY